VKENLRRAAHPYTRALLESIPRMGDFAPAPHAIDGQSARPRRPSHRLAFHPRCPDVMDRCRGGGAARRHRLSGPFRPLLARRARRTLEEGVSTPVIEARRLSKLFPVKGGFLGRSAGVVRAVDDVSFTIDQGQTLGWWGIGCGKDHHLQAGTGTGRAHRREHPLRGDGPAGAGRRGPAGTTGSRCRRCSRTPSPRSTPRMRVGAIIAEPLVTNESLPDADVRKRHRAAPRADGAAGARGDALPTSSPAASASASPSPAPWRCPAPHRPGRAGLRAGRLDPSADPHSCGDLQAQLGLSYLFIAHDLAAVAHMSHTIAVMYLGRLVESGEGGRAEPRPEASLYAGALLRRAALASRRAARGDHPARRRSRSPLRPPAGCASTRAAPRRWRAARRKSPAPATRGELRGLPRL